MTGLIVTMFTASAATIVVDQSGGGDVLTIEEGFGLLEEGDTLEIREGVYEEAGMMALVDDITIIGDGPDRTIIDNTFVGSIASAFAIHGDVTVSGIGFVGFEESVTYRIAFGDAGTGIIHDCSFQDGDVGMYLGHEEGELHILDSTFVSNWAGLSSLHYPVTNTHIENSVFVDNYIAVWFERDARDSTDTRHTVAHNVFIDNTMGVYRAGSNYGSHITISNNIFYSGEYVYWAPDETIDMAAFHHNLIGAGIGSLHGDIGEDITDSIGNVFDDPLFADFSDDGDWTNDDLRLLPGSPGIDLGTEKVDSVAEGDRDGVIRPLDGDWDGSALPDAGPYEYNPDVDEDGYGSPDVGGSDCDDEDATVFPDAEEVCEDGVDQDCDGEDAVCEDDTGPADTGPADTGPVDTGPAETWPEDTGPAGDGGTTDGGSEDGGSDDDDGKDGCGHGGSAWVLLLPLLGLRRRDGATS